MKKRTSYEFNSQRIYPETYLSNEIISFHKNWRDIVLEKLSPSSIKTNIVKPDKPAEPSFELAFLIGIPFFFGIFVYAFVKDIEITILLYFVWIISYSINFQYRKHNYPKLLDKFELELKDYENQLLLLNQKEQTRKNEIQKIKKELYTTDSKWSRNQRLEYLSGLLSKSKKARCNYNNPRLGATESMFFNVLKEYFHEQIQINKVIEIFSYNKKNYWDYDLEYDHFYESEIKNNNAYCPDFIFEHNRTDLTVDIEIDEPYTSSQPIHYLDSSHDYKRNGYFLENGWVIIRFSEMQIKLAPKSCCKEIAEVIYDLTGDLSYVNLLKNEPRLFRHNKWTKKEAETYIKEKIRKKYSELNLNIYSKSLEDIIGLWVRGKKYYSFKKDKSVIEFFMRNGVKEITDEGVFKYIKSSDGRNGISLKWNESKSIYVLENSLEDSLILTDVFNRYSYEFIRSKNTHNIG